MLASLLVASLLTGAALMLAPCTLFVLPWLLSALPGSKKRLFGLAAGFVLGLPFALAVLPGLADRQEWSLNWIEVAASAAIVVWGVLWLLPSAHKTWHALWQRLIPSSWRTQSPDATGWIDGIGLSFAISLLWVPCSSVILPRVLYFGPIHENIVWSMVVTVGAFALGFAAAWLALAVLVRTIMYKIRSVRHQKHRIKRVIGALLILLGFLFLINRDETLVSALEDRFNGSYVDTLHALEEQESVYNETADRWHVDDWDELRFESEGGE